ncbi:MAG: iron-sulfur cluster assembly scaffold protein [Promethearchaeota archaeon]
MDEFDLFVKKLQEEIDRQDREDFSTHALSLGKNPYKYGRLSEEDPQVIRVKHRGSCGDALILYLKIEEDIIKDLRYEVDGCVASSMAASQMALLIDKKSIADVIKLTPKDILDALGKFPVENHHCAKLAIDTLQKAIEKYKKEHESSN